MSPVLIALLETLGPIGAIIGVFVFLYLIEVKRSKEREERLVKVIKNQGDKWERALLNNTEVTSRLDEFLRARLASGQ